MLIPQQAIDDVISSIALRFAESHKPRDVSEKQIGSVRMFIDIATNLLVSVYLSSDQDLEVENYKYWDCLTMSGCTLGPSRRTGSTCSVKIFNCLH